MVNAKITKKEIVYLPEKEDTVVPSKISGGNHEQVSQEPIILVWDPLSIITRILVHIFIENEAFLPEVVITSWERKGKDNIIIT